MIRTFILIVFIPLLFVGGKNAGANENVAFPAQVNDVVSHEMTDWIADGSMNNVDFYYRIAQCEGRQVVFLKFENRNEYHVEITWKESFFDKIIGQRITGIYGQKQLVLTPGQVLEADCLSGDCKECITRSADVVHTHVVQIGEFNFLEVSVSAGN
jgi:hypothetical protein